MVSRFGLISFHYLVLRRSFLGYVELFVEACDTILLYAAMSCPLPPLCQENQMEVMGCPEYIKKRLDIRHASSIWDVFSLALV